MPSLIMGEKLEVSKDMDTYTRRVPLGVGAAICPCVLVSAEMEESTDSFMEDKQIQFPCDDSSLVDSNGDLDGKLAHPQTIRAGSWSCYDHRRTL